MKQTRKSMPHNASPGGFTLIEIAFAIMILAGSLVVLLGLQSASIQRSVRDQNKQAAMLIARQLFSAIETAISGDKGELPMGDTSETPDGLIDRILPGAASTANPLDPQKRFMANLNVTYWPVPGIEDEKLVKKVILTVSWSSDPQDSVSVNYFIPSAESTDDAAEPTPPPG